MGNCAPEDKRLRCGCCSSAAPQAEGTQLLDQKPSLRRSASGELGEERAKRDQDGNDEPLTRPDKDGNSESLTRQTSRESARSDRASIYGSEFDDGDRSESLSKRRPSSTSSKPRLPKPSKRSSTGFSKLADVPNELHGSRKDSVISSYENTNNSSSGNTEGIDRDYEEEIEERKAELEEQGGVDPIRKLSSGDSEIAGKSPSRPSGLVTQQRNSVLRRLMMRRSQSNNAVPTPGDVKQDDSQDERAMNLRQSIRFQFPVSPRRNSKASTKKNGHKSDPIDSQELGSWRKQEPRSPSPPPAAKGEVKTEDSTGVTVIRSNRPSMRRARSLLAEIGTRRPSMALQLIIENPRDIGLIYTFDRRELGAGSFGSVKRASVKSTGAVRAVKTISKDRMKDTMQLLKMEIRITKMVDHPNIIKLYELFEDALNVYLVMEICSGGQLYSYVVKSGWLSESHTCYCMRQLIRAVVYIHNHRICHRDIKPENVLLADEGGLMQTSLKLTDFGVSCLFKPNQKILTARVGTSAYMAPEVIKKNYTEICDMWSIGVTMYFLFCGYLPFYGTTIEEIRGKVCTGQFNLTKDFVDVSEDGIDLLLKLINVNLVARLSAKQALKHKWFARFQANDHKTVVPLSVFDALRGFRALNKFKKACLCLMASLLSKEQIKSAHEAFCSLDVDGDGIVSVEEIRERLREDSTRTLMPGSERVLWEMDQTSNEEFADSTYTEFIAANFDRGFIKEDVCRAAFSVFDQDGDGHLSHEELASGEMLGKMSDKEASALIADLGKQGQTQIAFEDFVKMMQEKPVVPKFIAKRKPASRQNSSSETESTKASGGPSKDTNGAVLDAPLLRSGSAKSDSAAKAMSLPVKPGEGSSTSRGSLRQFLGRSKAQAKAKRVRKSGSV